MHDIWKITQLIKGANIKKKRRGKNAFAHYNIQIFCAVIWTLNLLNIKTEELKTKSTKKLLKYHLNTYMPRIYLRERLAHQYIIRDALTNYVSFAFDFFGL